MQQGLGWTIFIMVIFVAQGVYARLLQSPEKHRDLLLYLTFVSQETPSLASFVTLISFIFFVFEPVRSMIGPISAFICLLSMYYLNSKGSDFLQQRRHEPKRWLGYHIGVSGLIWGLSFWLSLAAMHTTKAGGS